MTIIVDRQVDLVALARRTLGRPEHDKTMLPLKYIGALRRYVAKHPDHTNFLIDLNDQGGMVTCMVCHQDVLVGHWIKPGVYEFRDLKLFEDHVLSAAHKQKAAASVKTHTSSGSSSRQGAVAGVHKSAASGSISGPSSQLSRTPSNARAPSLVGIKPPNSSDVEANSSDIEPTSPVPSVIELSSSSDEAPAPPTKHKGLTQTRSWTFPDGEVITIESSSDDENMGDVTLSQNMVMTAPQASSSRNPLPPTRHLSLYESPRAAPLQRSISDARWDYRSVSRASSSRSPPLSDASYSHRKRPFHFPDGEIVYATESETDGSASKRRRYDPESDGAIDTDVDGMEDEGTDEEMELDFGFGPFARERADTLMPFPAANLPESDYSAIADEIVRQMDIFSNIASGSNTQYPDLGYHAPPTMNGLAAPATTSSQRFRRDFQINYDDESPSTWLDMGGPNHAEQLKRFFDETMDDHEAAIPVRDAVKALGLKSSTDRLPGMEVPLMPHQLIGVSWMVKQEEGRVYGGILADDMGLGKTMQTIALIVMNRPEKKNPRKGTLIVAPAALLAQWRQEILDRTEDNTFRVHIHHGKDKLKSTAEVKKYDIIITTYQTLANEFPIDDEELKKKKSKKKRAKRDEDGFIVSDSDENKKRAKKNGGRGPLAATEWYRVVLDEAQNIRNRVTRSSRMMALLDSEYRWALTGTPVTNSLADLYGLIRFLHYAPWNDWSEFNDRIAKIQRSNPKLAGQRAQALLKKCLLRRTKQTKLEGKPLITLQPKTIEIEELEFSPDERQIYAAVEARQQQKFNRFLRAGTVMKNYTAVLVMLLRLRQVCNHPQLIAYTRGDLDTDGAYVLSADDEGDKSKRVGESSSAKSKSLAKAYMGEEKFELDVRFRDIAKEMYIAELTGGNIPDGEAMECGICLEPYTDDSCVTSCGHIFCKECLNGLFDAPLQGDAAANDQFEQDARPCPNCRGKIMKSHIFAGTIFALSEAEQDEIKRQVDKEHGAKYKPMYVEDDEEEDFVPIRKGKGKARARIQDNEDEEERDEQMEADLKKLGEGDAVVPGAKMTHMAKLLEKWHREAPEDKIIAYSQYTNFVTVMQILLKRDGIQSLRFDGKMSRIDRDETLSELYNGLRAFLELNIISCSLKCGGFGLNLTEANRVICMDLAWNAATENQAIDRVHRMGQVKSVFVKRLIIKDTIEER
ncbi:DNA repair protein RAD5 [Ceratobasidium sp. AG-Ba]|nr:DNA repair protein RAD5 [Ceratobasidium sp. AG-Ba]